MGNPTQSSDVRRYEVKARIGDGPSSPTVTTDLRIEAAGTIALTQAEGGIGIPGQVYVPPTAHLTVLGDVVTIEGRLNFPGRVVKIVARRIEARSATGKAEDPAIIVDGAELDPELGQPKPLPKGVTPARLAPLTKVIKGHKGADATNNMILPHPAADSKLAQGSAGWSAEQHPSEMHGEPGENGAAGNAGGIIALICRDLSVTAPAKTLHLSARGGRGGDGQPGQDGADGGDGGEPFDARSGEGFLGAGFIAPVVGGEAAEAAMAGAGGTRERVATAGRSSSTRRHRPDRSRSTSTRANAAGPERAARAERGAAARARQPD
jgi:hypothetical protein